MHPQNKKERKNMELPKDPMMLFSFINMKLRDVNIINNLNNE